MMLSYWESASGQIMHTSINEAGSTLLCLIYELLRMFYSHTYGKCLAAHFHRFILNNPTNIYDG